MHPPHPDSEAALENATIDLFSQLQWETANCYHETFGTNSTLGRETKGEVVLIPKLQSALQNLNSDLSTEAIPLVIEELTRDRSTLSLANANAEIYQLLKDGVKVSFKNDEGEDQTETVKVIDWSHPENNNFFLASQFWVTGEIYTRRTDLIGFINGLPLVFIELKAHHQRLELAYKNNLTDYKQTIPRLFWYNAFIILSNGKKSRISSLTAKWEHYSEWKKINSEGEEGIISLDTIIRGTCEPTRLLDLIENFIFFYSAKGSLVKIVAKNHQYLGVNQAVTAVKQIKSNQGRLGVFWHTQGSGKSYSMVFFSQKVVRKVYGNWTFVIITDREDLDEQIYKNFAYAGAVTEIEKNVRAKSGEHLKQLLHEDHRYIFTMIQKFRTEKGGTYPQISDRSDIIVIADEAHRSQYDTFALNMRNALPHAAFIGFTGTPLMLGEQETKKTFGDYISIYNFRQSIEDSATVPLYYENRIPELQVTNDALNEDMAEIIESATIDEEEEKKLERQCAREYQLITRDDRLEKIAQDIVTHLLGRGYQGKAMIVSIDRFTAVKMYNKVQHHWQQHLQQFKNQLAQSNLSEFEQKKLSVTIKYMEETDMAVVISQSQNEVEAFQKKELDITPHRKRLVGESPPLDEKFKDASHPLRIIFVCAMWMTGFDVPSCSTIYLDKPMKNHSLMQTIARANRVFPGKVNGLIVDYIGVFRDLQKALAIYGSASGGGIKEEDTPVKAKTALVALLREAIAETTTFCTQKGIDFAVLESAQGFARTKFWADAVECIIINDDAKKTYLSLAGNANKLYKAILPDPAINEFTAINAHLQAIKDQILAEVPEVDVSEVMEQVEELCLKTVIVDQIYFKLETLMPDKQIIPGAFIKLELIDSDLYKIQWENITNRIMLRQDSEKKGEVNVKIKFTNLFSMRIINSENIEEKDARIPDITFLLYTINNMLQSIFSSYTCIGPLREEPSRRYIYEDEILEIGIKGENAAYIYSTEQYQDVVNHFFYDIKSNSFQKKPFLNLSVAVQEWLDLMNIKGFRTATLNEIIYLELNSSSASKTRVNIADVGFGVSQIFPIILEGLRMPWRSTLLLEQPEIHLHPNLQMKMADYFISLALSGKKVIVETHSDHIINRLVRRIVESETNQFKDLIAIYFISNTENGSIYEEINIDDERGVVNWPSGFFDQVANEQENIIRAGLRKRKFNRNRNL